MSKRYILLDPQSKKTSQINIEQAPIGTGGEGNVHNVVQSKDVVAKIYHPKYCSSEREQKLKAMVANPPKDPAKPKRVIAWPQALLYEPSTRKFAGFLMPNVKNSRKIYEAYVPSQQRQYFPFFNWRSMHRMAANLAVAVHSVHVKGHVIGDVNQNNFLVDNKALVTIIDTDSFQIKDKNGRFHLCQVGVPDYTPAELHGKKLDQIQRTAEHDRFGLAVLLFQLLMKGVHPFIGVLSPSMPSVGEVFSYCIKNGFFPYQPSLLVTPPPNALPFEILDPRIQHLFIQTFVQGHNDPSKRTDAREWYTTLTETENMLKQCSYKRQHWYSSNLAICPWCERETLIQQSLHKSPNPSSLFRGSHYSKQSQPTTIAPTLLKSLSPPTFQAYIFKGFVNLQNLFLTLLHNGSKYLSLYSTMWVFASVVILAMSIGFLSNSWGNGSENNVSIATSIPTQEHTPIPTKLPQPPILSESGDKWVRSIDNMTMIFVPGGTFPRGWNSSNAPIRNITVGSFWIDQTEVTKAQYDLCVANGACKSSNSYFAHHRAEQPIVGVDWFDAETYCVWIGGRLPTEAEWEYAARGSEGNTYPWGNEAPTCQLAAFSDCSGYPAIDVGSLSPKGDSWVGVQDMAGNVREYVNDWYDPKYYESSPSYNPTGPVGPRARINQKVIRGGDWTSSELGLRAAFRDSISPNNRSNGTIGFRCAYETNINSANLNITPVTLAPSSTPTPTSPPPTFTPTSPTPTFTPTSTASSENIPLTISPTKESLLEALASSPTPTPTIDPRPKLYDFTVLATQVFYTNLDVLAGQQIIVEYLSGEWRAGSIQTWPLVGPEGDSQVPSKVTFPMPNAPIMALIVKVGESNPQLVNNKIIFKANESGEIQLFANDDLLNDNSGELIVRITIYPPN